MYCLTFRHWQKYLTLLLVTTSFSFGNPFGLPDELVIEVDGKEVRGFMGSAEGLKEKAAESPEELGPEGFVYQVERGPDPGVQIAVWSITKKESKILKTAEAKLTKLLEEHQLKQGIEPSGFQFAAAKKTTYGRDISEVAPVLPSKASRKKVVENIKRDLAPVMASTSTEAAKISEVAESGSTWEFSHRMKYWIFLALLALVATAWGSRRTY